jgi:hypothetical protein
VKKHSIAKSRSFSVTSSQGERRDTHVLFFPPKTYSSKALLPRLTLTFLSFFLSFPLAHYFTICEHCGKWGIEY